MCFFHIKDHQKGSQKYIPLDFEIKFEILREKIVKKSDDDDSLG